MKVNDKNLYYDEKLERLLLALKKVGLDKRGRGAILASETKYSPNQVSWMLMGKVPLNIKFTNALCIKYHISEYWLETGEGEMLSDPEQPIKISERLTGYNDDIKLIADSIEIQVQGKTATERAEFIKGVMEQIWGKGR